MIPEADADPGTEDELAAALDAYLALVEAGRPVDPEEWVDRHPAIAGRLRACLRGLHLVEAAAEALADVPGPDTEDDSEPIRIGDFEVLRELGRGGMGVVYEAIEQELGRRVALKVLPLAAAIDPRQIARFRVEAQAASQLSHPSIVPVYSVGCQGGVHYYAMRLIDGPTLAHRIEELRKSEPARDSSAEVRASFREAARLARQAAEALEHAHDQGVLHRDIKPSNLMLDSRGHLWVTDFGLARFQGDSSLTAPGDLLGTLRYMSPEQATADHAVVDRRTDVYSLGATLYELLTLHPVFPGSDRQEILRRILNDEPKRPRAWRPSLPRDLETIVLKAMAKDPAGRYPTAQALADDLGRFLDDRPILARRPGPMERSARWARRHAAAMAVAVPMLAIAVVAMGVATTMVLVKQAETRRAHADALRQRDKARRAVDVMYTQFAEEWLGRQPALQPVQRAYLLEALAYYQEDAREHHADPAARAEAGIAAFRVGEIQRTLGRLDEAERAYRQAIAALEADSGGGDVLEVLGRSCGGLGQLLDESGRKAEARPVLERAVELTRRYADGAADAPHRAAASFRLGTLLRLSGRAADAESAYQRTIELARTMGGPRGQKMQAGALGNLGALRTIDGRHDEAERSFREAVTLYESMVRTEPEVPVYRQELARALDRLGALEAKRPGGRPEAERRVRRSLELLDRLAADSPEVPTFREELALTLLDLVDILSADGRAAEAEPLASRSVALFEELAGRAPPGPAAIRRRLVWALDRLSDLRRSAADAEPVLRRSVECREALIAEGAGEPGDAAAMASARGRLGALLAARGEVSEARRSFEQAAPGESSPTRSATAWMRCVELLGRDETVASDERPARVRDAAVKAREALRRAVEAGDDPVAPYLLAWFLTSCPAEDLRDPPEAIRIARGILERSPGSWVAWATLGAACYRDDDPAAAVAALEQAAVLHGGDLLHYGFFLAMARRRLDDVDRARDDFDRADRRLGGLPRDDEVRRLRDEAAVVLGGPGSIDRGDAEKQSRDRGSSAIDGEPETPR